MNRYTETFKAAILKDMKEGWTLSALNREHGIARRTLRRWRDALKKESAGRYNGPPDLWSHYRKATCDIEIELERNALKAEVERWKRDFEAQCDAREAMTLERDALKAQLYTVVAEKEDLRKERNMLGLQRDAALKAQLDIDSKLHKAVSDLTVITAERHAALAANADFAKAQLDHLDVIRERDDLKAERDELRVQLEAMTDNREMIMHELSKVGVAHSIKSDDADVWRATARNLWRLVDHLLDREEAK